MKYKVKFRITEKNRHERAHLLAGAEVAVELEAPHEKAAEFRAWLILEGNAQLVADGDGVEVIEVKEV